MAALWGHFDEFPPWPDSPKSPRRPQRALRASVGAADRDTMGKLGEAVQAANAATARARQYVSVTDAAMQLHTVAVDDLADKQALVEPAMAHVDKAMAQVDRALRSAADAVRDAQEASRNVATPQLRCVEAATEALAVANRSVHASRWQCLAFAGVIDTLVPYAPLEMQPQLHTQ